MFMYRGIPLALPLNFTLYIQRPMLGTRVSQKFRARIVAERREKPLPKWLNMAWGDGKKGLAWLNDVGYWQAKYNMRFNRKKPCSSRHICDYFECSGSFQGKHHMKRVGCSNEFEGFHGFPADFLRLDSAIDAMLQHAKVLAKPNKNHHARCLPRKSWQFKK